MQRSKWNVRAIAGSVSLSVVVWMIVWFDPVQFDRDATYLVAYTNSWWAGAIPGAFLLVIGLKPAVLRRATTNQHDVLPAEGGKGAPVGVPAFRMPATVLPLTVVLVSGIASAAMLISLPWHLAQGAEPKWIAVLAIYGVSGAIAVRDAATLIRGAFSSSVS